MENKAHARAAIMLSGKAPAADRAHIIARARAELAKSGLADGGMVDENDDEMNLGQAAINHVSARADYAADVPEDQRTPEDWQDIANYRDWLGTDEKSTPKIHAAAQALDRRKAAAAQPHSQPEEPAGRKNGGMVGYRNGGKLGGKAFAVLMALRPSTPMKGAKR